jgi:hypothetical protein
MRLFAAFHFLAGTSDIELSGEYTTATAHLRKCFPEFDERP